MHPRTYSEILTAAKSATIVDWYRDTKSLSIITDDIPADKRVCLSLRIEGGKCGRLDIAELNGFDPVKNRWGGYTSKGSSELPDRKGLKALMDWIRQQAVAQCEWIPNPGILSVYPNKK